MKKLICKWIRKTRNNRGFTMLEMLIVLIIVGFLMAIIIPNVNGQKERIEAQAKVNIAEIVETQVATFKMVEKTDATLATLLSKGYITKKQADEATRLLAIEQGETITVPIDIP